LINVIQKIIEKVKQLLTKLLYYLLTSPHHHREISQLAALKTRQNHHSWTSVAFQRQTELERERERERERLTVGIA